jgi:hypothetical protein
MFEVEKWALEVSLLDALKNDFGEVDEVMFNDFERP